LPGGRVPRDRRVFHVWGGFNTFSRLLRGFYRAASGKFDRESVVDFHSKLEANIFEISADLESGTYEWGKYRSFWVVDPKLRQIESAPFRDRVVHQAMAEVMEPIFDPAFFYHSYACRSGKGTHRAMQTLHTWISPRQNFHYLQMDVSKYFPSIDREILFGFVEKRIGDPTFLSLVRSLLASSPAQNGIPIGNLTSQIFANLYLDALDQFVKRDLRVKHYLRYMDDIVLLSKDLRELRDWRKRIEEFSKKKLSLRFHPHKVALGRVKEGITFVGYRIFPTQVRVKGKSLRRFRMGAKARIPLDQKVRRLLSYKAHIFHVNGREQLMADLSKLAFSKEDFMET
jgi:retron-type reverse transcriptase